MACLSFAMRLGVLALWLCLSFSSSTTVCPHEEDCNEVCWNSLVDALEGFEETPEQVQAALRALLETQGETSPTCGHTKSGLRTTTLSSPLSTVPVVLETEMDTEMDVQMESVNATGSGSFNVVYVLACMAGLAYTPWSKDPGAQSRKRIRHGRGDLDDTSPPPLGVSAAGVESGAWSG